jgi:predicted amidophosphoribosyltransferase
MDEVSLPTPPQPEPVVSTVTAMSATVPSQPICPRCHFSTKPEYYFCPNCGAKLTEPPIGTGLVDQLLLYAFSIILPWILYLAITKWQGIKYLRAPNARAKQIGLIALVLLIVSSVVAFWIMDMWVQNLLQGFSQSQTSDLNSLGL